MWATICVMELTIDITMVSHQNVLYHDWQLFRLIMIYSNNNIVNISLKKVSKLNMYNM